VFVNYRNEYFFERTRAQVMKAVFLKNFSNEREETKSFNCFTADIACVFFGLKLAPRRTSQQTDE